MNVIQKKTGARLSIPIYPALAEINAKEPSPDATYLQNQAGLQASANGLGNQFRAPANAAGVTGDLSGHGLRKAAARRFAEAGCTPHQIAAITGHKTLSEIERYTRAVDQKKLAEEAIKRMEIVKRVREGLYNYPRMADFCDLSGNMEVRAGIEPTYADLQSAASPFCHRTGWCVSYISSSALRVKGVCAS